MGHIENICSRYASYKQERADQRAERSKGKRLYSQLLTGTGNGKEDKRKQAAGDPGMY